MTGTRDVEEAINFGAGPAKLPREVLREVQKELLSYDGLGMSVMEISHRSREYQKINKDAQRLVRELLNVPDNYRVLFITGGGTGAFAAVAMNLLGRTGTADYCVTGTWSGKAYKEAAKYGEARLAFPIAPRPGRIPPPAEWTLNPDAAYVYYCHNETVDGVEFHFVPETNGVPLVVDMSSSIMTKELDISQYGCIFAGAQKNIGPAGVTVVIVREDLIGSAMKCCPSIFDFAVVNKENSIANTPATFSVYVMKKVFEWIAREGGVAEMERRAHAKAALLYGAIAETAAAGDVKDFYWCPIDAACRSRMNVPFRVGGPAGDEKLEARFLDEAERDANMQQLKGHRSVGGIRASLYNAVTLDDVSALVTFMRNFRNEHAVKQAA